MKKQDLKEMANRCRLMAGTADEFTKRRLLDLATKYEARIEGDRPRLATQLTAETIAATKTVPSRHGGER
jgi:hypothetical protein